MPLPPQPTMSCVTLRGRVANVRSFVFITRAASSALETTTVGTSPSLRNISGPCRRDSFVIVRCGSGLTTWWRLPMIGRVHGPGGSRLSGLLLSSDPEEAVSLRNQRPRTVARAMKHKLNTSMSMAGS